MSTASQSAAPQPIVPGRAVRQPHHQPNRRVDRANGRVPPTASFGRRQCRACGADTARRRIAPHPDGRAPGAGRGAPIALGLALAGQSIARRTAGAALVPLLLQVAARKKCRVFFLGGTPVSSAACAKLRARHPGLIIAGSDSPPQAHLLEMDHEEICRRVQQASPDLLFVSFGSPKEEKWIAMHYRSLGVPIAVGVGATMEGGGAAFLEPRGARPGRLQPGHRPAMGADTTEASPRAPRRGHAAGGPAPQPLAADRDARDWTARRRGAGGRRAKRPWRTRAIACWTCPASFILTAPAPGCCWLCGSGRGCPIAR